MYKNIKRNNLKIHQTTKQIIIKSKSVSYNILLYNHLYIKNLKKKTNLKIMLQKYTFDTPR